MFDLTYFVFFVLYFALEKQQRSVQGNLFNLLVMYSPSPWESMGFLPSRILTLLTITVTPLPLSFHISARIPLPSSFPAALEIHCGIDRKTSPVSLWTLGGMYITDQQLRLGWCVSMPVFQSLTFTRQKTCLTSPLACPLGERLGNRVFEHRRTHLSPDSSACKLVWEDYQNRNDLKRGLIVISSHLLLSLSCTRWKRL